MSHGRGRPADVTCLRAEPSCVSGFTNYNSWIIRFIIRTVPSSTRPKTSRANSLILASHSELTRVEPLVWPALVANVQVTTSSHLYILCINSPSPQSENSYFKWVLLDLNELYMKLNPFLNYKNLNFNRTRILN